MNYIDKSIEDLKEYFKVLQGNEYPDFIDNYINTPEMQRLSKVGQFCGCDYTKIFNIKCWYSRLDHSVACALMTYNFTKDKYQTLSALFHDLGTPAFSHSIDFLLGDTEKQKSSEKSIKEIIESSKYLLNTLEKENISIDRVCNAEMYPIVDSHRPNICVDRLDGVLATNYIWFQNIDINEIKKIYDDMSIMKNEKNVDELGFAHLRTCEDLFKLVYNYSIALQSNEDKFSLTFVSDCLKNLQDKKLLKIDNLYTMSESDIIKLINKYNSHNWKLFNNTSKLSSSNTIPDADYYVSTTVKKRYMEPLCRYKNDIKRIVDISEKSKALKESFLSFKDKKYAYIDGINFNLTNN